MFLKLPENKVKILFIPNPLTPFNGNEQVVDFRPFKTVEDYCTTTMPVLAGVDLVYSLNGQLVKPNTLVPKNSFITCNLTIQGGDSMSDTLNVVAKIALVTAAVYFLGPASPLVSTAAWGFGLSGAGAWFTGAALVAGATWAGSQIIDSVFPLSTIKPDEETNPATMGPKTRNYGYGPATNFITEGVPIPELLGTTKFAPALISGHRSLGMGEITDDDEPADQYLNLLYLVGLDKIDLNTYISSDDESIQPLLWIDGVLKENYGTALKSAEIYYNDHYDEETELRIPSQFSQSIVDKDVNEEITYLSETSEMFLPPLNKNTDVLSAKYQFETAGDEYLYTTTSGTRAVKVEVCLPHGCYFSQYQSAYRYVSGDRHDKYIWTGCKQTGIEHKSAARFKIVVYYRLAGSSDAWVQDDSYYAPINATRELNFELGVVFPSAAEWEFKVLYEIDASSYGHNSRNGHSSVYTFMNTGSCSNILSWAGRPTQQPQFKQWSEFETDYASSQSQSQGVDSLSVILAFPNGLYKLDDSGGYEDHTVKYEVTLYKDNKPHSTKTVTVTHSTTNAFRKKHTFDNLDKGSVYSFKVRYAEPPIPIDVEPNKQSDYQTTLVFDYVQECIDNPIAYVGCTLLELKFKATATSMTAPLIEMECSRVFDTLKGSLASYSLNSPAWASVYFLRKCGVPESEILLDEFEDWALFCTTDDKYSHAYDTSLYNYLISWYIDEQFSLREMLDELGRVGRALVNQKGTKWGVTISRPTVPKAMFSDGNIRKGSYSKSYIEDNQKANAVVVWFWDEANNYARTGILVRDSVNLAEGAVLNKAEFILKPIKSKEHAKAFAIHTLNQTNAVKDAITWEASIDAIGCSQGDVVYFGKSRTENLTAGGRLVDATKHTAIIDDTTLMESDQSYKLAVRFNSHDATTLYTCDFSNRDHTVNTGNIGETTLTLNAPLSSNIPLTGNILLGKDTEDEISYPYTNWSGAVLTISESLVETHANGTTAEIIFERIIPVNETISDETPETGGIEIDGNVYTYTGWEGKFFTIAIGLREIYEDNSELSILFDKDLIREFTIPPVTEKTIGNDLYWKSDFWKGWSGCSPSVFDGGSLVSSNGDFDIEFDSMVNSNPCGILDGTDYPTLTISVTRESGSGWDSKFTFTRFNGTPNIVELTIGNPPSIGVTTEFQINLPDIIEKATSGRKMNREWQSLINTLKFNLGTSSADTFTINFIKFAHQGINTSTLQLSDGWTENNQSEIIPEKSALLPYSLGKPNQAVPAKPVRITNIERADGLYFKITACSYDEDSYVENAVVSVVEEYPSNISYISNLTATEKWRMSNGLGVAYIELSWRGLGSSWRVSISHAENSGFEVLATVDNPKYVVPSDALVTKGITYYFKVEQVGLGGSNTESVSIDYDGMPPIPIDVESVSTSRVQSGIEFTWNLSPSIWVVAYDLVIMQESVEVLSIQGVAGDSYIFPDYLDAGIYSCHIKAVDLWGQKSENWTTCELIVSEIPAPASIALERVESGVRISWDIVEDIWPVHYKLLRGSNELTLQNVTGFLSEGFLNPDTYTYRIEVYNENGTKSINEVSDDLIVNQLPAPVGLNTERVEAGVRVSWGEVSDVWPLSYKLYRNDDLLTHQKDSGFLSEGFLNPSTYTYRIECCNGNQVSSTNNSTDNLIVENLSAPILNSTFSDIGQLLTWNSITDIWPLSYRILLDGDELGVNLKDVNLAHNVLLEAGTHPYTIEVYNGNNVLSINSYTLNIDVSRPNAPENLQVKRTGDNLIVEWAKPAKSSYPVTGYDLKFYRDETLITLDTLSGANPSTDDYAGTTFLAKLHLTTRVLEGCSVYRVGIVTKDSVNDSVSSFGEMTINKPAVVEAFNVKTIDNVILLDWGAAELHETLLPVSHYKIKRSESTGSFATATDTGDKDGTFTSFFEYLAGMFTYYVQPVDVEGNLGAVLSKTVEVGQDPNFTLNREWYNVVKPPNPESWESGKEYKLSECVSKGLWEDLTTLPSARAYSVACEYDGKMYVYGGTADWSTYLSDFYSYDFATGVWATLTSGNVAAGRGILIPDGAGKIYYYGGWNGTTALSSFQVYDISNNVWTNLTGNHPSIEHTGAHYNGKIYIALGHSPMGDVWEYTIATGAWVEKTSGPALRRCGYAVHKEKYLYCVTGYNGTTPSSTVYVYNMLTDEWKLISEESGHSNYWTTAGIVQDKIIVFGGNESSGSAGIIDELWTFDLLTHDWKKIKSDEDGVYLTASCVYNNELYCFSGLRLSASLNNNFRKLEIATYICNQKHTSGTGYDEPATFYGYAYWERYRVKHVNAVLSDGNLIVGADTDLSFDEWWGSAATFDDIPHNSIHMPSIEGHIEEEFDYFEYDENQPDGERLENDGSGTDDFLDSSTLSITVTNDVIGGLGNLTKHLQGVRTQDEFTDIDGNDISAQMFFQFRYLKSKINFVPATDQRLAVIHNNTLTLSSHSVEEKGTGVLQAVPQDNLIAWWKLDDDSTVVTDFSGNENHGALVNASASAFTDDGFVNYKALTLDSDSAQHATIPADLVDIASGNYAISMWIFLHESPSEPAPRYLGLRNSDGSSIAVAVLYQNTSTPNINIRVNDTPLRGVNNLEFGKFYHVTLSVKNDVPIIYINKVLEPYNVTGITGSATMNAIGSGNGATSYTAHGKIDDVRLYSDSLTSDQVSALYEQGAGQYINFSKEFVEVSGVHPSAVGGKPVLLNALDWDEANPEGCRIRAWDTDGDALLTEQKYSYRIEGFA